MDFLFNTSKATSSFQGTLFKRLKIKKDMRWLQLQSLENLLRDRGGSERGCRSEGHPGPGQEDGSACTRQGVRGLTGSHP